MSRDPLSITRRNFVRVTAGAAGVLGTGLLSACEPDPAGLSVSPQFAKGGGGGGKGGGQGGSARNPLRIPPTQAPTGVLTAAPAEVDLGGGVRSRVWAYNGQFPGPTLVAPTGSRADMTFVNGLSHESITHWHGMIVDTPNDGHPREAVPPGGSYVYDYPIIQRASLNFYHPHPHGMTGEQVAMGLAGAYLIRDDDEAALGLPSGPHEVPLIVRDATFDRNGNMQYKPRSGGFEGNTPLVNGTLDPALSVDTGVYRFRILNGCNARILRFAFSDGTPFVLIGNDGGFLEASVSLSEITICPAERLDVLVDLRGHAPGTSLMLQDLNTGWDLLELTVDRSVADGTAIPGALYPIERLTAPVRTREFSFDGMSKINGQVYDMARVDFQVPFGETELWRFTTNGNAPHPVHVHGAYYQVVSRSGGRARLYPWEGGWKDTVLLEDGETVEILIRFDGYRGLYLMHCHKLEHEDMGMMSNFEVV
ncbi:MAG: multicopper oxidase domain-containing protein [Gemmatimonadota bacterium]|nr:multicopper oxidase domain-containing protein [Gemmatimonadota bacterium]